MTKRPATPENHRLYVVGDIHGRLDLLGHVMAMVTEDAANFPDKERKLIFLGDYVDRGLDSRGVLERLLRGTEATQETIFIRGNHDDMFAAFLKGDMNIALPWLSLGGAAALASYGIVSLSGVAGNKGKLETLHKNVLAKVPPSHLAFLEQTVMSATFGDYYFVHAGVRPRIALDQQNPMDQMAIRGEFLFSDEDFGKVVVHGHTIRQGPEVKPNRIALDTGAFATGCLTCLILDGTEQIFYTT